MIIDEKKNLSFIQCYLQAHTNISNLKIMIRPLRGNFLLYSLAGLVDSINIKHFDFN